MRIAHVIPGYLPAQGGIEALVDGVSPVLKDRFGIESFIIPPRFWRERPEEFVNACTPVLSIDMPQRYSKVPPVSRAARLFRDTRAVLSRVQPDIVHLHGIGHLFAPATNVAKSLGIPVIHHIHGEVDKHTRSSHLEVLRGSKHVAAVSNPVATSVHTFAQRSAPVTVIPNGIPEPTKISHPQRSPRIAMVGRLEAPKGFAHGLMAAARIKARIPDLHIDVVGLGEELIALQSLVQDQGIADCVNFYGRLDRTQTHEVMSGSTVVVIPSLIIEGFSLVAAEAAFLGKPVVAYRVGGLSETVIDQITGALVGAGDVDALAAQIQKYLSSADLTSTDGKNARDHARSAFSVQRYAQDLGDYYRTVFKAEA
jgi:glycosyltransferase involved in cell wall biosynthesis